MISVDTAVHLIQQHLPNWGTEKISLSHPRYSRLAVATTSDRPYPPIDRIMMDGIALQWAAYASGQRAFLILGVVPAGEVPPILTDEQACFEVMTGAALPQGCDLVIPYEALEIQDGVAYIHHSQPWSPYQFVHRCGSDAAAGQQVLAAGAPLHSPAWGILASVGQDKVSVRRTPRTQIIATGNELIPPDAVPQPYQLRISNAYALLAALKRQGYAHVSITHLPDDPVQLAAHYRQASQEYDIHIPKHIFPLPDLAQEGAGLGSALI
ncbi:MAG: molybdopterin molybdotransferase MoeA [Thermosynechococcus sp.]|uniref:molybdopterin molybdotransferase MoeA n=1 Tax=Thermosynechococcus sp. TaxID=2814275 RepID=UPI0039192247